MTVGKIYSTELLDKAFEDVKKCNAKFSTVINKISVEMIGENEESIIIIEHEFIATTQVMINISRKRLCNQASKETREVWQEVLNYIKDVEPELYNVCVPDCIYREWCYEYK
ncbi:hypothetical protein ACJDU8_07190 [Clostridium sp. WILCCON 0269]|uniref:Uncharacterized protein n=1 Tax=Candidatus Clostridium eludens TaxID=3381663 RepID=A0ABW8SH33_9CLOT